MNNQSNKNNMVPSSIQLNQFDVICGRSKLARSSTGNKWFRSLIKEYAQTYKTSITRTEKAHITKKIACIIQYNGGRFLIVSGHQDEKNPIFEEASYSYIYEKISHALRSVRCTKTNPVSLQHYHQQAGSTNLYEIPLMHNSSQSSSMLPSNLSSYDPHELVLNCQQVEATLLHQGTPQTFIVSNPSREFATSAIHSQAMNLNQVLHENGLSSSYSMKFEEGPQIVTPPESPAKGDMKKAPALDRDEIRNLLTSNPFLSCTSDDYELPSFEENCDDDAFDTKVFCPVEISDDDIIFSEDHNFDNNFCCDINQGQQIINTIQYNASEEGYDGDVNRNHVSAASASTSILDEELSGFLTQML